MSSDTAILQAGIICVTVLGTVGLLVAVAAFMSVRTQALAYKSATDKVLSLLSSFTLLKTEVEMMMAGRNDLAAALRDRIEAVERLMQPPQEVVAGPEDEDAVWGVDSLNSQ